MKSTYREIQDWVKKTYGWQPKTCWIAHCKALKGLPVRTAWNRQGRARVEPCPPDKRRAIFKAFEHFGMKP